MKNKLGHKAISASAGSGKTYQLSLRYLELLAAGVAPEKIVALTFSRKAAGEIFDAIIARLCERDSEEAQQLLRMLLDRMSRLHIGTLDSFTVGMVRMFPLELGVPPDFEVMDGEGPAARLLRRDALSHLLGRSAGHRSDQKEFLEAFKQATFGQEEKGLFRNLDRFIEFYQRHYRLLPDEKGWGGEPLIWPKDCAWLRAKPNVEKLADALDEYVTAQGWPDRVRERWSAFTTAARAYAPASHWSREIEYMMEKLTEALPDLANGHASINVERKECSLDRDACRAALGLVTRVICCEIGHALERTRGVFRLLSPFEILYAGAMRRSGRLTFDDVQYLLTNAHLSRKDGEAGRLYLDYRVDAQLDHWLLDEFQDTSDLQWEALRNLIDEILQDASGARTFFYVGDVKQAIYGWRGGNSTLFGRLLDHYGDRIKTEPLARSFRSAQPVIDLINDVFDTLPGEVPDGAVAAWKKVWTKHSISKEHVPKTGYAVLLEPDCAGGARKPEEADRFELAARIVNEVQPTRRQWSMAVLVRKNENGAAIVNHLRAACPGERIVHEGNVSILDSPVVLVLRSLVQFAAHPGDTMAWRHLQMSPLAGAVGDPDHLPLACLSEIQADGFASFFQHWGGLLQQAVTLDVFGLQRLEDLLGAAREFDKGPDRSCDAFLNFLDAHQIRDLAPESGVRVMTVHQAKGLGFDAVIVPDLQSGGPTGGGAVDFVLSRDQLMGDPTWALRMPRRLVATNDETLGEALKKRDAEDAFEELCTLYVALTRARQGLYVITSYGGRTSKALTSAALVKLQLTGDKNPVSGTRADWCGDEFTLLYEKGKRDWYEARPVLPAAKTKLSSFRRPSAIQRRLRRVTPSRRAELPRGGDQLFAQATRKSLTLGLGVHSLFEQVEWIDDADDEKIIKVWLARPDANKAADPDVSKHFQAAFAAADVRASLAKATGDAKIWQEKPFEVVLGEEWVTGTFDRVVIEKNRATIYDFKTNEIRDDHELAHAVTSYEPQMKLYRRALSKLTGLPETKIECKLIFTSVGRVVVVAVAR